MLARCGQSALYLAREPYELFRLSSKRGSVHSLYFCAVWPFGVHGGTFRQREKWARRSLQLRLWIGWRRRWGHFGVRFGPFSPAGRGVRPPWAGPRFGLGLFWRRFTGQSRCVVAQYAVRRFLSLLRPVHTLKLICVFLQAGGAECESSLLVRGPGHPALRLCCPVPSHIGRQIAHECKPRPGQRGVCGWGIHCPVHRRFEGQPVRPGVVGVVRGVVKAVPQCQWGRRFRFLCECVDLVRCARGVSLCHPPCVLVAR